MELSTFSIPTFRRQGVQKRLEKLAKKAAKYGNDDITCSFGRPYMKTVKTAEGNRRFEYVDVTVSGEAPQIAGWQLLARVELMGEENLIHSVPGVDATLNEDFRSHDGHCDHCNSLRRRNDVYVLTNADEQIAVGRTCLRDFLGIDDPKGIVSRAQFFEEIRDIADEDVLEGFSSRGYFDLPETLAYSAAYIRRDGYVSRAKQQETGYETTGDCVAGSLKCLIGYEIDIEDVDREWADKTIAYFRSAESFDNDYMDNLRVLMNQDAVNVKHLALVSSSVIAVQRKLVQEAEAKKSARQSDFVGEVKQRLKGLELLLEKIIFLGSGNFGPSYLHLMKDDAGNVFSWITGNKIEVAEGSKVKVDASVKQHKVYNDTKQTVLTRAKVLEG